jgi:hypothetical protein
MPIRPKILRKNKVADNINGDGIVDGKGTIENAQSYLMLVEDPDHSKVFAIHHDYKIERFKSEDEIQQTLSSLDDFGRLVFTMALEIERLRGLIPKGIIH